MPPSGAGGFPAPLPDWLPTSPPAAAPTRVPRRLSMRTRATTDKRRILPPHIVPSAPTQHVAPTAVPEEMETNARGFMTDDFCVSQSVAENNVCFLKCF